ncbi:MAG: HEAT repeat domain-containing protein, partial [Phycisphaerales bacterium]
EPLLLAGLKDPNAGVRSTAAMMIGRLKLADAAPACRPLATDPSPFARASAIYALSRCGQPVNSTPLARLLLHDPSTRVRAHVAFLLGELGEPSAAGLLREAARGASSRSTQPAEQRLFLAQVSEALVKLGEHSQVEPIRAHLYPSRPEDLEATALAAQILGQLRDKGSTDELIYLTAYKDRQGNRMPAEIRLAAAGSLARLGNDKGSFVADEYAASDMAVLRAQSAFVYGEIGRAENLPKLEKLLGDQTGIVRVSAAGAVLKLNSAPVAAR